MDWVQFHVSRFLVRKLHHSLWLLGFGDSLRFTCKSWYLPRGKIETPFVE